MRYIYIILMLHIGNSQTKENNLSKDFFDFGNEKAIAYLGMYNVIKFTDSEIVFNKKHKDITDKTLYKDEIDEFNFNGTYKVVDLKFLNKVYYFKFGWHQFDVNSIFKFVNWIGEKPSNPGDYEITAVNIPFIQHGKIKVCTIGDSQTWWSNALNLRKFMNDSNEEFIFIGSNQDVYGYFHEGEGGNSISQVLDRVKSIPYADIYTVLLGTNDYKGDLDKALANLTDLINKLRDKNEDASIFYITPLPTTNKERNDFNTKLKKRFIKLNNEKVHIIKLGEYIENINNWEQLFPDGLHASETGYHLISLYLTLEINNWIK